MSTDVRSDFAGAFGGPQALHDAEGRLVRTRVLPMGTLAVPSGTIAVGDPLTGMRQLAFDHDEPLPALRPPGEIGPGPFPVEACVASYDNGDERVACVRVRLGEGRAVRWEHSGGGAGVDSGTAAFADGGAVPSWDDEAFLDTLGSRVEAAANPPTCFAACLDLGEVSLAIVSSGWGDGIYGALWGLSEDGEVVELVLDFDLLTTAEVVSVDLGTPSRGDVHHPLMTTMDVRATVPWIALGRQLYVQWDGEIAYARWKLPDGRYQRIPPKSTGEKQATFDIGSPPEGAQVSLAMVVRWIPMPRAPEPAPTA